MRQSRTREPQKHLIRKSRDRVPPHTTLEPRSLFRVGKILIYANTDYHKLHFTRCSIDSFWIVLSCFDWFPALVTTPLDTV